MTRNAERGIDARQVVFFDPSVGEVDILSAGVPACVETVVLAGDRDPMAQMAAHLSGRQDLAALHIVSHGRAGELAFTGGTMDAAGLAARADALRSIGSSLVPGADILLYACEVGAVARGRAFIDQLSALTGASVAAAAGPVGAADRGGSWSLDVVAGEVSTPVVFTAAARSAYADVLAAPSFNDGPTATLVIDEDATGVSIDDLLDVLDTDVGDTLAWSMVIAALPSDGTLAGFSVSLPSNGGTVTPTGLTFSADADFSGSDSFNVDVFDGSTTDTITITVTVNDAPEVVSIVRESGDPNPTNADALDFTVTFSEAVDGVDWSDFTVSGATITPSAGTLAVSTSDNITYTVTVSGGDLAAFDGDVGLDLVDDDSITSQSTTTELGGEGTTGAGDGGRTSDETFTVDNTPPTIAIGTIAGDDRVNATEELSDVTVAGTTTGVEDGQTVTVNFGGLPVTTTVTSDAWSVTVPAAGVQALSEGTLTVTADVSDQAGNPAGQATTSVALDRTAPTIAIDTIAGDDRINATEDDSAVIVSGTTTGAADGQTVTVDFGGVSATTVVSSDAWSVSIAAVDVQGLAEGAIAVTADVSDLAGNAATQASASVDYDRSAPVAPVITTPIEGDGVVNAAEDGDVLVEGTSEANATVDVSIFDGSNPAVTAQVTADGSGDWTLTGDELDVSGLDNGSLTVSATQTDAAGNTSAAATETITLDNVVAAPVITTPIEGDGLVSAAEDNDVVVAGGGAEALATVDVSITDGTTTVSTTVTADGSGDWTLVGGNELDVSALDNGSLTVSATQTDGAGNTSAAATETITLDNQAPSAPVITTPIEGDGVVNAAEEGDVLVEGTGEANATVDVSITDGSNPAVTAQVTADGSGNWSLSGSELDVSGLDNGSLTVSVTQTDMAGNTSAAATATITLDNQAPAAPVITTPIEGDGIVNAAEDGDVLVEGTGEANATVDVSISDSSNPAVTAQVTADGSGSWTLIGSELDVSGLDNGSLTVSVTQTDAAGNISTAATETVTLDNQTPSAPVITTPIEGDDIVNAAEDDDVLVEGTGEANATIDVSVSDGSNPAVTVQVTADGSGDWTLTGNELDVSALDNGPLTVSVIQTDVAGNISAAATRTVTLDNVIPTAPTITTPIEGDDRVNAVEDDDVLVEGGGAEAGATIDVSISDGSNPAVTAQVTADGSGDWTLSGGELDVSGLDNGPLTVSVTQTDAAGNVSVAATETITLDNLDPVAPDDPTLAIDATVGEDSGLTAGLIDIHDNDTDNITLVGDLTATPVTDQAGDNGGLFTIDAAGNVSFDTNGDFEALAVGDTDTTTYTFTVADQAGNTDTSTLTVTVEGVNDDPVADDDTADAVEAGGVLNGTAGTDPSGDVTANDTDVDDGTVLTIGSVRTGAVEGAGVAGTVGGSTVGAYGTLALASDGTYTYAVDNTDAAVEALDTGDTLTDSFNYTVDDGDGGQDIAVLTVTITGVNDTPVAVADIDTGPNDENDTVTIDVLANDTDVDGGDSPATFTLQSVSIVSMLDQGETPDAAIPVTTATASIVGNALVFDPGTDLDILDAGDAGQVVVSYTMTDDEGATATASATIDFVGSNDDPGPADTQAEIIRGRSTANVLTIDDLLYTDPDRDDVANQITYTINGTVAFGVLKLNGVELGVGDSFTQQDIVAGDVIFDHNGQGSESLDLDMFVEDPLTGPQAFVWTIFAPFDVKQDGTSGEDTINAPSGQSLRANGRQGNDVLNGDSGSDALFGGDGSDILNGHGGRDQLMGQDGNDIINGHDGNDRIFGGDGFDILSGGAGADRIDGGEGNNEINGGSGADTIFGGSGFDLISGDAGNDTIVAKGGNDQVSGGLGNDDISGQAGSDFLYGDDGNDTLRGGSGNDTLGGGIGDDLIFGGGGQDIINGDAGDDELRGGGGGDQIYGGADDDTIIGWTGDDFLYGQAGEDVITGGDGSDHIWGGSEADVFVFTRQAGPALALDTIYDFEVGVDTLDLTAFNVAGKAEIDSKYDVYDDGTNTRIDFGFGDEVLLLNVSFDDLTDGDFLFGP